MKRPPRTRYSDDLTWAGFIFWIVFCIFIGLALVWLANTLVPLTHRNGFIR